MKIQNQHTVLLAALTLAVATVPAHADTDDFFNMSLEEILQTPIVSLNRQGEALEDTAAAVFVLTDDDIRRYGVTSIPEALRLVPGIHVQRIDSNTWGIGIRGFGGRFSNKLLVLQDGRNLYDTFFAGVFWDQVDLLMEDIERIEVIRGPGGTLWGANAVNGIINIVTKSSRETNGGYSVLGGGNLDQIIAGARYGSELSPNSNFRMYAKTTYRDELPYESLDQREANATIPSDSNTWNSASAGMRYDFEGKQDQSTFQIDINRLDGNAIGSGLVFEPLGQSVITAPRVDDLEATRVSALGRWNRRIDKDSNFQLQSYFMYNSREDSRGLERQQYIFDFDSQASTEIFEGNTLQLGAGYRGVQDNTDPSEASGLRTDSSDRFLNFSSVFLTDSQKLLDDKLTITIGTKVTYNPFSEFDAQPSVRVSYRANEDNFSWAAYTRAVRVPSRSEDDFRTAGITIPTPGGFATGVVDPSDNLTTETVDTFELGHRLSLSETTAIDITGFYNNYDDLSRFRDVGRPGFTLPVFGRTLFAQPLSALYEVEAESYGIEVVLDWILSDAVKLQANYAYLETQISQPDVTFTGAPGYLFQVGPEQSALLRVLTNPFENITFDGVVRYVDISRSPNSGNIFSRQSPSIVQLDLRLGWDISEKVNFSVTGLNLLSNEREYNDVNGFSPEGRPERNVVGRVTFDF